MGLRKKKTISQYLQLVVSARVRPYGSSPSDPGAFLGLLGTKLVKDKKQLDL
jgi:hypothetical protein